MTRIAKFRRKYLDSEGFKVEGLKPYSKESGDKNIKKKDNKFKEERRENRRLQRQDDKQKQLTCFNCRETGHSVKNCPKSGTDASAQGNQIATGICYHCGSTQHSIKNCKHPNKKDHPFKFASCFVCQGEGHLASQCPENDKGLYPNGGSCKYCKSVQHLAKDCKPNQLQDGGYKLGKIDLEQGGDDDDLFLTLHKMDKDKQQKREQQIQQKSNPSANAIKKKVKKVVNF